MRAQARYVCDYKVTVLSAGGGRIGEGRLLDISLGGAAFLGPVELKAGVSYRLVFEGLELLARLTWSRGGRRGVAFVTSVAQEEELKRLLSTLRKQAPPRDYWNV